MMDKQLFEERLRTRISTIYGDFPLSDAQFHQFLESINQLKKAVPSEGERWNEKDVILITYGDSVISSEAMPLPTLHRFLNTYLADTINYVHILPFFPYSSDDGFSVIDYKQVNPDLGDWSDVEKLGKDYKLMFDLVINHASQHSTWFQNYLKGRTPGSGYFIEADPKTDLSAVVRPRSLPLLTAYDTVHGKRHVWTTFSADQVDLNFSNPELLVEMMNVFLFYLSKGARIIRLDAIAFLWKEIGTSCLHLPQTHEVVKLMRDIADYIDPGIIILTETNVPNKENLSYFGQGDEASMVYQFSLPPLLLHALYTGNSGYLNKWAQSISSIPENCTFFNFTASHDGIGVRPLEGLLPDDEIKALTLAMKANGGHISTKRNSNGTDSPYEMNITYFDAMKRTSAGEDDLQFDRFICSQTLMMSFKGIPAFYIHSLLGTQNFHEGVKKTGMPRSINRRRWNAEELFPLLEADTHHKSVLQELTHRIAIRKLTEAFHPDAEQEIINLNAKLFCIKRGTGSKQVVVLANLSNNTVQIEKSWLASIRVNFDLLSEQAINAEALMLNPYQVCWLIGK